MAKLLTFISFVRVAQILTRVAWAMGFGSAILVVLLRAFSTWIDAGGGKMVEAALAGVHVGDIS